jgi:hypothetical protein
MFSLPTASLLILVLALPGDDAWKTKRAAEWSDADTKQVLTDSPWAAMSTPAIDKKAEQKQANRGNGVGIGMPGMGRRRMNQPPPQEENPEGAKDMAKPFLIRWESALPIREAELKARETNAPAVDEDRYAVAVYGLPAQLAKDPRALADRVKGQAALKREGQKDLKPISVDVIPRDDGAVVVFLFAKKELVASDGKVEFSALIGVFQFTQTFQFDQMIYQGKLEL